MRAAVIDWRAQPITNLCTDPACDSGPWEVYTTSTGSTFAGTAWFKYGSQATRLEMGDDWTYASLPGSITLEPGQTVQAGVWVYYPAGGHVTLYPRVFPGNGFDFNVPAGTPTFLQGSATAVEASTGFWTIGFRKNAAPPGTSLWMDGGWYAIQPRPLDPERFIYGDMPGCRWLGAPSSSPSVGWPRPV